MTDTSETTPSDSPAAGRTEAGHGRPRVWSPSPLVLLGAHRRQRARRGAVSPRIAQPRRRRGAPAGRVLFGYDHWLVIQIGTIVMMMLLVVFVRGWRRHGPHPVLLMVIAAR